MIKDFENLNIYLEGLVNRIFKILPLYEEKNDGVYGCLDSLIFELNGLEDIIPKGNASEYLSLLSTLISLQKEITKEDTEKKVIKREIFKCINITKNISDKIQKEGV